ncbi:MAG: hypothetical protein K9L74_02790 [Candidatus Izimaplasma sp.]|nr:hypothetical protein [Candidatus Izimaplasma bacterium]
MLNDLSYPEILVKKINDVMKDITLEQSLPSSRQLKTLFSKINELEDEIKSSEKLVDQYCKYESVREVIDVYQYLPGVLTHEERSKLTKCDIAKINSSYELSCLRNFIKETYKKLQDQYHKSY